MSERLTPERERWIRMRVGSRRTMRNGKERRFPVVAEVADDLLAEIDALRADLAARPAPALDRVRTCLTCRHAQADNETVFYCAALKSMQLYTVRAVPFGCNLHESVVASCCGHPPHTGPCLVAVSDGACPCNQPEVK